MEFRGSFVDYRESEQIVYHAWPRFKSPTLDTFESTAKRTFGNFVSRNEIKFFFLSLSLSLVRLYGPFSFDSFAERFRLRGCPF